MDVAQIVARLVVARIERVTSARVERCAWDAELDEADKVGAGAESPGEVVLSAQ